MTAPNYGPVVPGDLNENAARIHEWARNKGFWDKERNLGEMLMLMTSELAECLEEDREDNPPFYVTDLYNGEPMFDVDVEDYMRFDSSLVERYKPEGVAVELVDAMIRILDTLGSMDVDIDAYIEAKMRHNETRARMHGKKY